jgi:hypothetical protein
MAVRKPAIVHDLYLRLGRLVIEAGLARIGTHHVNSLETTPRTRRTDELAAMRVELFRQTRTNHNKIVKAGCAFAPGAVPSLRPALGRRTVKAGRLLDRHRRCQVTP